MGNPTRCCVLPRKPGKPWPAGPERVGYQLGGGSTSKRRGLLAQVISQFRLQPRCEGRASPGNDVQRDKAKMVASASQKWAIASQSRLVCRPSGKYGLTRGSSTEYTTVGP